MISETMVIILLLLLFVPKWCTIEHGTYSYYDDNILRYRVVGTLCIGKLDVLRA